MSAKRNRHRLREPQGVSTPLGSSVRFRVLPKKKLLIFVASALFVMLVALFSSAPPPRPPGNPFASSAQQTSGLAPIELPSLGSIRINISPVASGVSFDDGVKSNLLRN